VGPRRARKIAEAAEAAGEPLDEKPVTLAIHEVAEGRLEAGNANLTADEDTAE